MKDRRITSQSAQRADIRAYRPIAPTLLAILCIFGAGLLPIAWGGDNSAVSQEPLMLVRVDITGNIDDLGIPVQADFVDEKGQEYILSITTQSRVAALKVPYKIIDGNVSGNRYLIARERRTGAIQQAAALVEILHQDGKRIIVKSEPGINRQIGALGFELTTLRDTPMILTRPRREAMTEASIVDPLVQIMMKQVTQAGLSTSVSGLSGVTPVTIGGAPYRIQSRQTDSGVPIDKATRYVHDQLKALGLNVEYHYWTDVDYEGRNVIAELPGLVSPDEIILVTAHLDDQPDTGIAPGADDNASGTAAALLAARIMKNYRFDRTIRFAFFTGEEQDLLGSWAYAEDVSDDDIKGVINMDMIAYNTAGSQPIIRLHTRPTKNPGYSDDMVIANQFATVVKNYGLSSALVPVKTADGDNAGDHYSFWHFGFAAIMAIEDDDDFNPYYHTPKDTLSRLNLPYFQSYTQAAIGTAAHLAGNPRNPTASPDFLVASISLNPAAPARNGIFTAAVTVKNSGNTSSPGGTLSIWLNRPTAATCDSTGNSRLTVGTVAAGAMKTLTFSNLKSGPAGNKTFRTFVDSGCDIKEASETNNQTTKSYTVK